MASITRQQTDQAPWYQRLKTALYELEFVTSAFTWLFRLASRVAEPAMTIATIYVIIEAGVPAISVPVLHLLAIAIMISAPEVILPGGFILASEIKAQGNKHYKALYIMCWLFVILTSATLADLFIWHFMGAALATLMWTRCAAAVGYSILFRVITYKREIEVMPVTSVLERFQAFTDQMTHFQELTLATESRLKAMDVSFSRQIERLTESVTAFQSGEIERQIESLAESLQTIESRFQFQITESLSPILETLEIHAESLSVLPMLAQQIDMIGTSTQLELRTVTEEFRQVRFTVEKQAQVLPQLAERAVSTKQVKPVLKLPAKHVDVVPAGKFDKRQFVFECLSSDSEMTIGDIQKRAAGIGQTVSVGTISTYRNQFQFGVSEKEIESDFESETETENEETESQN